MRLSEDFVLSEFAVSSTHPRLVQPVPPRWIHKATMLAMALQRVRDVCGPVTITSGYRAPALNLALDGSGTSQHTVMEAVDFRVRDLPQALAVLLAHRAERPVLGQVIYYPKRGFIHVALSSDRFPVLTLCLHRPPQFKYHAIPSGTERVWLAGHGIVVPTLQAPLATPASPC